MNLADATKVLTIADLWKLFYPEYEWRMNGELPEYHLRGGGWSPLWTDDHTRTRIQRGFANWLADGAPEFRKGAENYYRNEDRWQGY